MFTGQRSGNFWGGRYEALERANPLAQISAAIVTAASRLDGLEI